METQFYIEGLVAREWNAVAIKKSVSDIRSFASVDELAHGTEFTDSINVLLLDIVE